MPPEKVCVVSGGPAIEFIESPLDQTVPAGGTAVISVGVSGDEPVDFQWWGPGGSLSDDPMFFSGTGTCVLTIQNVLTLFSGDYWVVATSPSSTNTSALAKLTVVPFRAGYSVGSRISFPATVDRMYRIEYSPNLDEVAWFSWGDPVLALEPEMTLDFMGASPAQVAFRAMDVTP
jgi:hypothetical protein